MKKIGFTLIALSAIAFCYFKFVVVKIAYTTFAKGQYFGSGLDTLIFCYTQPPVPGGVYNESFGPVDLFKNYITHFV